MKGLGLFRHAKSSAEDVGERDFERALNKRGRRGAALMGGHIRDFGLLWQRAIASPAVRVRETMEEAAKAAGDCPPIDWDNRVYLAAPATLIDILRELDDRLENVMLCGHSPGLEELLFELARDDAGNPLLERAAGKFPTAAFAVLELDIDNWAKLAPDCGRLVHFIRPRDLDPELGPSIG